MLVREFEESEGFRDVGGGSLMDPMMEFENPPVWKELGEEKNVSDV